jgi:hypothetical protein
VPVAGEEKETFTKEEVAALIADNEKGLKANQAELLKDVKATKAKLSAYEGVDPEKYKQLEAAAAEAERKKAAAEGDFKSLEQQLTKKYESMIEVERGEKTKLRTSMERNLVDAAAAQELAKHSDSPKMLLPHIRAQMKVVEQDGEFYARVVDGNGNVRIGTGQGSAPMSLSELIEEMKQDKEFAPAFRGSGSSGSGAGRSNAGGGGAGKTIGADSADFMKNVDKIATNEVKMRTTG